MLSHLASALVALPVAAADYQVHVVDPPVTNHLVLPDDPLPPVCRPAGALALDGCRGQSLPLSIVVSTSKGLEKVRVEALPVRGAGREWPLAAVDVRVVKLWDRGIPGAPSAPMPTLLVHDDSFLAIEPAPTEENPDRLTHVARGPIRDTDALRPVDIKKRRQFWVTVHIPPNAKPGDYETTLLIAPQNSDAAQLQLTIQVYPFDLLPPSTEYSIYYPVHLEADHLAADSPYQFGNLSADQMLAEFQNMRAHGLNNPNIYDGPQLEADGDLDFTKLDRILDLREKAGLRSRSLYILGHPLPVVDRPLTDQERQRVNRYVPRLNAWARSRGYDEVFFAMADEWWGEQLSRERDSMIAINPSPPGHPRATRGIKFPISFAQVEPGSKDLSHLESIHGLLLIAAMAIQHESISQRPTTCRPHAEAAPQRSATCCPKNRGRCTPCHKAL